MEMAIIILNKKNIDLLIKGWYNLQHKQYEHIGGIWLEKI
jgi:hypothetical protein